VTDSRVLLQAIGVFIFVFVFLSCTGTRTVRYDMPNGFSAGNKGGMNLVCNTCSPKNKPFSFVDLDLVGSGSC
jgi:hypothetical protein